MTWKPGMTLHDVQAETVKEVLDYYDGNRTHAAKELGLSIRTVLKWINILGLPKYPSRKLALHRMGETLDKKEQMDKKYPN